MDSKNNRKNITDTPDRYTWVLITILMLTCLFAYYNSLNSPFILDDKDKIVENQDIGHLDRLVYPYDKKVHNFNRNDPSRPMTYFTFFLNYRFGKLNPFGYHIFNTCLHVLNTVLLFLLIRNILFLIYKKDHPFFPFFTALLFASHPINTSAVTYVFSRSDLLAAFFYLSSLLLFINTLKRDKKQYTLSILCFILALLSKQSAVTLPAMILLIDYMFLSNFDLKNLLKRKSYHLAFWGILLVYLAIRYAYLGGIGDIEANSPWGRGEYLIIQPYVIQRYLQMLAFPTGLCIDHAIQPLKLTDFRVLASFLILIGIFISSYYLYKKKTDSSKLILFFILWFIITLSPTSSFFPTTTALAENRLYLAGIGPYVIIVFLYYLVFSKSGFYDTMPGTILIVLLLLHVFSLGLLTFKRNRLFDIPALMWEDVISKYPGQNARAYNNLGIIYAAEGNYNDAITEFDNSLKVDPAYANAHYNLGLSFEKQGVYDKAIDEYDKTLIIDQYFAKALLNLGNLYYHQKTYLKAIDNYQKILDMDRNNYDALNNLAVIYYEQKRYKEALEKMDYLSCLYPSDENIKTKARMLNKLLIKK